jgi:hypothetical protein
MPRYYSGKWLHLFPVNEASLDDSMYYKTAWCNCAGARKNNNMFFLLVLKEESGR